MIVFFPLEVGKPSMKSMLMAAQALSRMVSGYKSLDDAARSALYL